jgi:hypothetical protein
MRCDGPASASAQEVDDEEVQDDRTDQKVGESSLGSDGFEFGLVGFVRLYTQRSGQNELANSSGEAGDEAVEWEIGDGDAIDELNDTKEHKEYAKRIDEL